jgi:Rrf2 family iron-sulfur cluster assembly transcriptional regulator
MIFSRASQYAIRALTYLAIRHPSGLCPLEKIATDEKIPQPFLGKILQGLAHKRLVRSSKGLNGGFALAIAPEKITLYSIVDAVDNLSFNESDCVLGRKACNEENPCPLHPYWKVLRANHLSFLHSLTLQQVCDDNSKEARSSGPGARMRKAEAGMTPGIWRKK